MQNISPEGVLNYKQRLRQLLDMATLYHALIQADEPTSGKTFMETADAIDRKARELHDEMVELELQYKHAPDMPVKGEYYSYKDWRVRTVIVITDVDDHRERNRTHPCEARYRSMITGHKVLADGKRTYDRVSFTLSEWMTAWAEQEIGPVENVLLSTKDITPTDIERVRTLLPFVVISEGRYLCLDWLRRLAKNARNTAMKEVAEEGVA